MLARYWLPDKIRRLDDFAAERLPLRPFALPRIRVLMQHMLDFYCMPCLFRYYTMPRAHREDAYQERYSRFYCRLMSGERYRAAHATESRCA